MRMSPHERFVHILKPRELLGAEDPTVTAEVARWETLIHLAHGVDGATAVLGALRGGERGVGGRAVGEQRLSAGAGRLDGLGGLSQARLGLAGQEMRWGQIS